MLDQMFGGTTAIIEKSLDVRMLRQSLIAANVANSETPGYRSVDVDFEETMRRIAERIHAAQASAKTFGAGPEALGDPAGGGKIGPGDLVLVTDDSPLVGNDSNTVSMENEIAKLQENRVLYSMTAQLLGMRFRGMANAIEKLGSV